MKTLPFTKQELLKSYKRDLNKLLDDCDWISSVSSDMICNLVSTICEKKGVKINEKALKLAYTTKVNSLKLTDKQWREEYCDWETGVPKIIGLIYEIIENKFGKSK